MAAFTRANWKAWHAAALTWAAYLAFVFLTDWQDFGLEADPSGLVRWRAVRIATISAWLLPAALLLAYRDTSANCRSFTYAFTASIVGAIVAIPSLVPANAHTAVVAGTVLFYALVSGLMCSTIKTPMISLFLGLAIFAGQLAMDASAHLLSGVFRVH